MMQFLGISEDIQNRVKALATEWGKPEDFEKGFPTIRALLEGKNISLTDIEKCVPGYELQVQNGKAYIGTVVWHNQRTHQPSQKVIEIETLPNYLQEGWKFISALPDRKCVIERTN